MKFSMKVQFEMNYQQIEDLFVTAIEGGCDYWMDYIEPADKEAFHQFDKVFHTNPGYSTKIADYVCAGGVLIVEVDEDQKKYRIDKDSIALGISAAVKAGYFRNVAGLMAGDYDAVDADIIFQHIVLGSLVYG